MTKTVLFTYFESSSYSLCTKSVWFKTVFKWNIYYLKEFAFFFIFSALVLKPLHMHRPATAQYTHSPRARVDTCVRVRKRLFSAARQSYYINFGSTWLSESFECNFNFLRQLLWILHFLLFLTQNLRTSTFLDFTHLQYQ